MEQPFKGDLIVGTIPANGGNSTKTRHATKKRSSKDTRMDQPKASSSKRAAARALQLNMQICYLLRWRHRSGVVRQETGERVGYLLEMQRRNRKSTKEGGLP